MEVKDFKVSISPREAAEVLEKHMDEDVLGEILDAYELQTEQGEVACTSSRNITCVPAIVRRSHSLPAIWMG